VISLHSRFEFIMTNLLSLRRHQRPRDRSASSNMDCLHRIGLGPALLLPLIGLFSFSFCFYIFIL